MQATASARFVQWLGTLRHTCGERFCAVPAGSNALFIGDIALQNLAGLELVRVKTNVQSITRSAVGSDGDRYCFLVYQRSGRARLSQNGLTFELKPGDIGLLDSAGTCEIEPLGFMEQCSIHLPRHMVTRRLKEPARIQGKLSQASASGRMVRLICDQLCNDRTVADLRENEGHALLESLVALLSPSLDNLQSGLPGQEGGCCMRNAAEHVIQASLSEPNLTPALIADQLGISVRQLYRLFEEEGDSVCRYIQRTRLHHTAADLLDSRLSQASITDIAFKWGFVDSAHFSRAFKKQFDMAPRSYRRQRLSA